MALHVARLDPQHVFTAWKSTYKTWDRWFCGLRTGGLAPSHGYPADNVVWAGFDNFDDGGTFCRESIDYVFRGGVQFDLDQAGEGVPDGFAKEAGTGRYMLLNASLEFFQQEPHDNCETYVYRANGDWVGGVLDDYLIPASGSPADYIDTVPPFVAPPEGGLAGGINLNVTDTVLSWLDRDTPNYGFCFLGPDESMPEDRNDACVNQFGIFKLALMYLTLHDSAAAHHTSSAPMKPRIPHPSQRVFRKTVGGRLPETFLERLRRPAPHYRHPPQR
ncbi:MAG: hypothetical protein NVS2B1_11990 [Bradyrhizobium sp.]